MVTGHSSQWPIFKNLIRKIDGFRYLNCQKSNTFSMINFMNFWAFINPEALAIYSHFGWFLIRYPKVVLNFLKMGQNYFQHYSAVHRIDHIKYKASLVLFMQFPNGKFQSQNTVAQGWWQLNSKNYLRNKCTLFHCFLRRFGVWKIFFSTSHFNKKISSENKIQIFTFSQFLSSKNSFPLFLLIEN